MVQKENNGKNKLFEIRDKVIRVDVLVIYTYQLIHTHVFTAGMVHTKKEIRGISQTHKNCSLGCMSKT